MTNSAPDNRLVSAVFKIALVVGVVAVLYFGKSLLLTLTLAGLLAMLINPLDNRFRSWGWSANWSIAASVFVLSLFFVGLFAAVGQQAVNFANNWEETQANVEKQLDKLRAEYNLQGVIPSWDTAMGEGAAAGAEPGGERSKGEEQRPAPTAPAPAEGADSTASAAGASPATTPTSTPVASTGSSAQGSSTSMLIDRLPVGGGDFMGFLSQVASILGDFLLMFVYIILLLSQKERLREFVLRRMPDEKRGLTHRSINESTDVVQKYLRGRLILIAILSVLYSIGFLLVGMDYAILIAILVAVLSIIPYLGNIIGGVFAIALALAGGGGTSAMLGVIATISVAQVLESYILTPLIVGDEVDINPLTTVLCVVGLAILWGPVGAIIAIPLTAILRIVFSHVDGLRDWAYLLGTSED